MLQLCTSFPATLARPVMAVEVRRLPLSQNKSECMAFSRPIHTAYFWTTHPTPAGSLLNPSFLSLLQCQGFHPGQWERCQPHASTQSHKHIVAEEKKAIHPLTQIKTAYSKTLIYNALHPVMHQIRKRQAPFIIQLSMNVYLFRHLVLFK